MTIYKVTCLYSSTTTIWKSILLNVRLYRLLMAAIPNHRRGPQVDKSVTKQTIVHIFTHDSLNTKTAAFGR